MTAKNWKQDKEIENLLNSYFFTKVFTWILFSDTVGKDLYTAVSR